MVSAKCNRQRNMTWHGRGKIRSSANKTKLNLMSMDVNGCVSQDILCHCNCRTMALYYCSYCDCNNPKGNLDSSSSAQLHLGKGSEFCFRFRAKLWMGVGQDPKLVSENTMQCYMAYFTILSIFFSMWLSNGSQMEGTMQHEMGVTRFDHPHCDREAIWQKT